MTEDHRFFQTNRAETAVIVIVQVTTANATSRQPQFHFATARRCHRVLFDAKIFRRVRNNCFHSHVSSNHRRQQRASIEMRGEIIANQLAHGLAGFHCSRSMMRLQQNIIQREKTRVQFRLPFKNIQRR